MSPFEAVAGSVADARDSRRQELAANLGAVRHRLQAAAHAAGRNPDEICLIAVTKTWPAADVRLLAGLGVTDVGESRDQEASAKHEELADLPLRWHFVGQLQRNKIRSVVSYADVVQSVDRAELVTALDRAAQGQRGPLEVLIQVDLRADRSTPGRGGAIPEQVADLAASIVATASLRLGGVMAVAPRGVDPAQAFSHLAAIAARVRTDHPSATVMSAGMSGDLEVAVAAGATHVRIGSALLGHRPDLR